MDDLISRQAAIDFIDAGHLCNPNEPRWSDNEVVNFLKSRPSAQRTGRWIDTDTTWSAITDNATIQIPAKICSKCGKPIPQIMWKNYCPNCGAKMEVEE